MSHNHRTDRNHWEARAHTWMNDHPEAMKLFEELAMRAVERGRRFGIGLLTERIRWEFRFERADGEQFKLNNNYRAYIARELIRRHPAWEPFIEFREVMDERSGTEVQQELDKLYPDGALDAAQWMSKFYKYEPIKMAWCGTEQSLRDFLNSEYKQTPDRYALSVDRTYPCLYVTIQKLRRSER